MKVYVASWIEQKQRDIVRIEIFRHESHANDFLARKEREGHDVSVSVVEKELHEGQI